jgi:hypothetical protein
VEGFAVHEAVAHQEHHGGADFFGGAKPMQRQLFLQRRNVSVASLAERAGEQRRP